MFRCTLRINTPGGIEERSALFFEGMPTPGRVVTFTERGKPEREIRLSGVSASSSAGLS